MQPGRPPVALEHLGEHIRAAQTPEQGWRPTMAASQSAPPRALNHRPPARHPERRPRRAEAQPVNRRTDGHTPAKARVYGNQHRRRPARSTPSLEFIISAFVQAVVNPICCVALEMTSSSGPSTDPSAESNSAACRAGIAPGFEHALPKLLESEMIPMPPRLDAVGKHRKWARSRWLGLSAPWPDQPPDVLRGDAELPVGSAVSAPPPCSP